MAATSTIIMKYQERSQILVLGDKRINLESFTQRRLSLKTITFDQLNNRDLTNNARGIILAPLSGKFRDIERYFAEKYFWACELGLMTGVFSDDEVIRGRVIGMRDLIYKNYKVGHDIDDSKKRQRWMENLPWFYESQDAWALAEQLVRHNPGPPLKSPFIDMSELSDPLEPEYENLLKRAFHDADKISIKRLPGGKTAKEAFCVYVNLANARYGPQPMPFFVKMGNAWKIEDEKSNYRDVAEPFIPFHLRPSLNAARSVSNLITAALVCNFVESAVSLREALRAGQGQGSIFSLFEITLGGLRSHTLNTEVKPGVIESFIDLKVRAHEIAKYHSSRIEFLCSQGQTRNPTEIETTLRGFAAQIQTREGPYHGDLHFGNIMVRNRDAILIDLGSMGLFGPLYADPAVLEVSLVFGTDEYDDLKAFENWRKFVDYIFLDPLKPPLPTGDYPQFVWLHKAIRELRHVVACCGVEVREALIILAACLMRYGRNTPLKLKSDGLNVLAEKRRTYALLVAYRICERLEKKNASC